jgi:hypothetical protein
VRPEVRPGHRGPDSLRDPGRGRLLHRRADPGSRGHRHPAVGILRDRLRDRPQVRRPVRRRRGPDRLRADGYGVLGLRELGRHARPRHPGQGDRQRRPPGRLRDAPRDRTGHEEPYSFQHVRR